MISSPHEEAEETEEGVHEAHVVGDARDDGLLAVRTHRLHRRRLEHLALQHGHRGGAARRGHDGGRRVAAHVHEGAGAHVARHGVREVAGRQRRRVDATFMEKEKANRKMHD